jgi:hypothetical protein
MRLTKQTAYGDNLLTNLTTQCVDKIKSYREQDNHRHIFIVGAPTGVGKTHLSIQEMIPKLNDEFGTKVFFYTAPQSQLVGKPALQRHLDELETNTGLRVELVTGTITDYDIEYEIERTSKGRIVLFAMTDTTFNNRVGQIQNVLDKNNFQYGEATALLDEAHYGSVSHRDYLPASLGSPSNDKYNAVKFNNVVSLLDSMTFIGFTATRTIQMTEQLGTDKYIVATDYPIKDQLIFRTAAMQDVSFYDDETNWFDSDSVIINWLEYLHTLQVLQENRDNHFNIPNDLRIKKAGLIKLETSYKNKVKNDVKMIRRFLNDDQVSVSNLWDFQLAITSSKGGIELYDFSDGVITKIDTHEYEDDNQLIRDLNDYNHRLNVLVVINKATMGTDVPNLSTGLVLRTPVAKNPSKDPVTLMGQQLTGRFVRLKKRIELLTPHFDNKKDFINYYVNTNVFRLWLPETPYWESMLDTLGNILNSEEDLRNYLNSLDW